VLDNLVDRTGKYVGRPVQVGGRDPVMPRPPLGNLASIANSPGIRVEVQLRRA
jgi:hypothetical protein